MTQPAPEPAGTPAPADDLVTFYGTGDEHGRLPDARNQVEWRRTLDLLRRWLPPAPARVLDVGGASGRYSSWLVDQGHRAAVVDLVPRHATLARQAGLPVALGDARRLPIADASVDAVLLMGPLYHLRSGADRALALAEAARCTRPGGVVVAVALSRWAVPATRALEGRLDDDASRAGLLRLLEHGHDPHGRRFDRLSYAHDVTELRDELTAAGLTEPEVLGVEGPLGCAARLDTSLLGTALAAAHLAQADAPHLSIHLAARGRVRGWCTVPGAGPDDDGARPARRTPAS